MELTPEEVKHIKARRELALEAEKKRIEESKPFDLDEIRPGMSKEQTAKAVEAIKKSGWLGRQD